MKLEKIFNDIHVWTSSLQVRFMDYCCENNFPYPTINQHSTYCDQFASRPMDIRMYDNRIRKPNQ